MARPRSDYVCRDCGYKAPRPLGRCPTCSAWSTFDEVVVRASSNGAGATVRVRPRRLAEIRAEGFQRLPVPINEFSRVLGGGIVQGSLVLIGGDPGVGKSTLLTQVAAAVATASEIDVLYVSGEESLGQVALRTRRMGLDSDHLLFASETDIDTLVETIQDSGARLAIVDSIQSVMSSDVEALPGSVAQLRQCAQRLLQLAKSSGIAILLVGHVTKEGAIAGPKLLEHMVDGVLYLEGERFNAYRILRSAKNRFGPTHEVGIFEMRGEGLAEVTDPSAAFLAERSVGVPGSVVTVAMEGTRPLLVEVQALVSKSSLPVPRRTANGLDTNRLHLMSAVLARRIGVGLFDQDVYVNVVGGLRIDEPAADLATALAIASSYRDRPLPSDLVVLGEVGLSGELRSVGQLERRVREASKLGFRAALVPATSEAARVGAETNIELVPARSLREALDRLGLSG